MIAYEGVKLEQVNRIFAKLIELGVNKKWLIETNPTPQAACDLLKGILYLREMQPDTFKDQ